MKIKIGEVDVELRYTFNSFKYMKIGRAHV